MRKRESVCRSSSKGRRKREKEKKKRKRKRGGKREKQETTRSNNLKNTTNGDYFLLFHVLKRCHVFIEEVRFDESSFGWFG